jgi:hypothetical protein
MRRRRFWQRGQNFSRQAQLKKDAREKRIIDRLNRACRSQNSRLARGDAEKDADPSCGRSSPDERLHRSQNTWRYKSTPATRRCPPLTARWRGATQGGRPGGQDRQRNGPLLRLFSEAHEGASRLAAARPAGSGAACPRAAGRSRARWKDGKVEKLLQLIEKAQFGDGD